MRSIILNDSHIAYILNNPSVRAAFPSLRGLPKSQAPERKPCNCSADTRVEQSVSVQARDIIGRFTPAERDELRRLFSADQIVMLRFGANGQVERLKL